MTDTRRWLKKDERAMYDLCQRRILRDPACEDEWIVKLLEQIAECKRLLKKREWAESPNYRYAFICLECKSETGQLGSDLGMAKKNFPNEFIHEPDCALARQTEGLPVDKDLTKQ